MGLKEYNNIIHRCFRCGYCKFTHDYGDLNCPAYKKYQFETYSTGGKMWLIHGLMMNDIKWSENLANILYSCPTCGNCDENCHFEKFKGAFVDIIEMARSEAFKQGFCPEKWIKVGDHVGLEHNPYFENHSDRLSWIPTDFKNPENSEIAFFVGCTSSYREKEIAKNTFEVLIKLGIKFSIFSEEWCCGSPLFRTGQFDQGLGAAEHNSIFFESKGIKTVITACAGCYRTLKVDYPKYLHNDLPFEVLHFSEYLKRLLDEGKIQFKSEFKKKVTYHDPCHLGRHSGIYEDPREVIKQIPGIEFVEMKKIKGDSTCCGAGGGVKAGYPEWSLEMARGRVEEALETEAEVLITTCPFCERNFSDAIEKNNLKIIIMDLVEIINNLL
ncbi:MAG: disulfide reductase [archaeon]|nr:disulfide reductase [archaeon]